MKATWLVTLLAIGLAVFTAQVDAQEHDHSMHDHDMHTNMEKSDSDKARCAFEGMLMKKSAMIPMKHGDETLYFCTEAQKAAFQKNPKRYLRKVDIGHQQIAVNVLTMKEYMDMMKVWV